MICRTFISDKVQGEPTQSVKSNLAVTERKNAIIFNLKVDSVQGRLGIYAWMITVILSWHLLTSDASFSKSSQNTKSCQNIHKIAFFRLI